MPATSLEEELVLQLSALAHRPYDFVLWAFPWGEPGSELEHASGPERWQEKVLFDLQENIITVSEAIQIAIKSGHNVGKTALLSWLVWWAFSTRVDTKGRCTANTEKQLRTILWSELAKWHRMFIARQFFKWTATRICSADPEHENTWRVDAVPWSEDNPDAWSGLHNYGGRIIMIFDEASGIADPIWERADGVTREANTEIIWIATSNPTKNFGRFYDCFDRFKDSWFTYTVDSREVKLTNHAAIEKAIKLWGEDDDYTRVRFLGEFPNSSFLQLIPIDAIKRARCSVVQTQSWEPLILGVDIARFGNNLSVAQFRRGRDARSIPARKWRGIPGTLPTMESGHLIASMIVEQQPDAVFIDEGGVGGGVVDFVRSLGHKVIGVNFGGKISNPPDGILVANKRAEMYVNLRSWLQQGGCIADDDDLGDELTSIEYKFDKKDQILLMSKEDMRTVARPSPDWADALAMTFAFPAAKEKWTGPGMVKAEYDPLSQEAAMGVSATLARSTGPSLSEAIYGRRMH